MKVLVVVDLQNDFCLGGALPVPGGEEIVPVVNKLMTKFDFVMATREVHPADHCSFASQHRGALTGDKMLVKGRDLYLWPDHCVEATPGAAFHPDLNKMAFNIILRKGQDKDDECFSPFGSHGFQRLIQVVKATNEEVYVCGLATEYCVKAVALDLVKLGFKTNLVEDACRGIDPEITKAAIAEMYQAGIRIITSKELD